VTTSVETRPRSAADRLARQLLRVEGAEPRTLMPLKGSLVISAVRCVITYVMIPVLAPVISGFGLVATPLSLALAVAAGVMAVVSLRRVWLADWTRRWAYTAFIAVVLVLLGVAAAFDVRTLLG
jgi:prepilin signal peptidase PulO-like enzyme (type II secretory pathway)